MKRLTDEVFFYPKKAIRDWLNASGNEIEEVTIRPNWRKVTFVDECDEFYAMMIYRPAKDGEPCNASGCLKDSEIYLCVMEDYAKEMEEDFCKRYDAGELD